MKTCLSIFASVAIAGAIIGARAFEEPAEDLTLPGQTPPENASDCPFFPGHENLYVANPTRTWNEIEQLTRQVAAKLQAAREYVAPEIKNFIDEHVFAKQDEMGVPRAGLCTDEEFIRRVYLDLTGQIPSPEEVREFVSSRDPLKRDLLIDSLIGSEGYVYKWTNFFGDLLQLVISSATTGTNLYIDGRSRWYEFIRDAIGQNMPYNKMVTALITAVGDTFDVGPANFIARDWQRNGPIQDTYDNLAVTVGRAFLGLNLECISCHSGQGHTNAINLYLTGKERYEFWRMAAFFSRVRFQSVRVSDQPLVVKYIVSEAPSGEYQLNTTSGNKTPRQPRPGQPSFVKPAYIITGEEPANGERYREALARILTSDVLFAKATVNYLWKELFGIGIVEPADGFDLLRQDPNNPPPKPWTIQPTHPELLNALAEEFSRSGFDLRHILGLITKSSTYQLSSRFPGEWKEEYVPFFARKYVRRLKAEEIHDAIVKATGVFNSYTVQRSYDNNYKSPWIMQLAMQLPDPTEPRSNGAVRVFLDAFLRGNRDGQPRKQEGSILQALTLLNNTFVTSRVRAANQSRLQKLLASGLDNERLVEEIFLAVLSRSPTAQERDVAVSYLSKGNRTQQAEDLMFALINKVDFIYNY